MLERIDLLIRGFYGSEIVHTCSQDDNHPQVVARTERKCSWRVDVGLSEGCTDLDVGSRTSRRYPY